MNDTHILKIIKNNIIFIVAFSILLLLYIIYLCYQIYKDSQKVKQKYVTKCPDYWDIGEEDDECNAPHFVGDNISKGDYTCGVDVTPCVSFSTLKGQSPKEKHDKLCTWMSNNKSNENISWDSLQCQY